MSQQRRIDAIMHDLTDPIDYELLEDPIAMPCCGKAVGRKNVITSIQYEPHCPFCRGDLSTFNPNDAPKLTNIASIIEHSQGAPDIFEAIIRNDAPVSQHKWTVTATPLDDCPIHELKISLENSTFKVQPTLFIAVVDNSGSMCGSPWKQVQMALVHILSLTHVNPLVKLIIIVYNSDAQILNTSGSLGGAQQVVRTTGAGGGTIFGAAFDKVIAVLKTFTTDAISNVTVAFMTDGQAGDPNSKELPAKFRAMLQDNWAGDLSVHAIGFSNGCDRNLLEEFRKCGNIEGTFRYAEPGDDDDTLCQKLQSLFEFVSKNTNVPIHLRLTNGTCKFRSNNVTNELSDGSAIDIRFPINDIHQGEYTCWITGTPTTIEISSALEHGIIAPIQIKTGNNNRMMYKWIACLIDEMAAEILALHASGASKDIVSLHGGLLLQRIDAMIARANTIDNYCSIDRLNCLRDNVDALLAGQAINMGKLSDMRFGSLFNDGRGAAKGTASHATAHITQPVQLKITAEARWKEPAPRHYSRNNEGKNRNSLQCAIMDNPFNNVTHGLQLAIDGCTYEDVMATDVDGNNAIILAAYCGQSCVLEQLLARFPHINLNAVNADNETALTLAIKKRGFFKSLKLLIDAGASVTSERRKGLQEYAVDNGYIKTSAIIARMSDSNIIVDKSMTAEYIQFAYELAIERCCEIDVANYMDVAVAKCMTDLVSTLITKHGAVPTIHHLLEYAIPPIPDCPDVQKYLDLANVLLEAKPELIHETDDEGATAVFKAAEKGNLPHVRRFIEAAYASCRGSSPGCSVDAPNNLGNTPLWIACAKRYPCIITELLNCGADVNRVNLKGNPPMYSVCQKGPKKVAEILLARGAACDHVNNNGDTLILICVRNGQHEILELLLQYVEPEFVDRKAHIDGFNAILAAVEANRPECIRVLQEYGVNLETPTDADNKILPLATPLHLAAYYGRTEAAAKLLEYGVTTDVPDANGQTALHLAVIQGYIPIIRLLLHHGANINTVDKYGCNAAAYCRNRSEIRKVLVNPALDALMSLSKGSFSRADETRACEILRKYAGCIGCLRTMDALNITGNDGSSPLMQAVIHSTVNVVNTLIELGADPNIKNTLGLTAHVFAHWIGNPRIKRHFQLSDDTDADITTQVNTALERLRCASGLSTQDSYILFLGSKPAETMALLTSGIDRRMTAGIECRSFRNSRLVDSDLSESSRVNSTSLQSANNDQCAVDRAKITSSKPVNGKSKRGQVDDKSLILMQALNDEKLSSVDSENLIWNAKVFTVGIIAANITTLTPQQIMAICMYTNNGVIAGIVDPVKLGDYHTSLISGLSCITNYEGEAFIGCNAVDRTRFLPGQTVQFHTIVSASTMWRVACEHLPEYGTKKKEGTIFIVKSSQGKFVGTYSQFPFDAEVLFVNPTFQVTNWYLGGDFIVLGQENIREYTYGLTNNNKTDEIDRFKYSNKSLVIELTEIV